jgi:hypothetical protein
MPVQAAVKREDEQAARARTAAICRSAKPHDAFVSRRATRRTSRIAIFA